jgi:branched-chain amino acid aminotransferase
MSQKYVHINGQLFEREKAVAPLYDHGLLYGDGVFEGIRSYNGRVFKLDEHLSRLYYSMNALAIDAPVPVETMKESVLELCRTNDHQSGYIRLTITRGNGLGLDPAHLEEPSANVYISTEQLKLYPQAMYDNGLDLITVSTRLPPPIVIDPRIKCTGKYTNNIRAKMEANRYGAGEGLMLDLQGFVAECTGDNIFVIKDGVVRTPSQATCGLVGVTRNTVIDLAGKNGFVVDENLLTQYDVLSADECFLTGTGAEVIPAVVLDGRKIGAGVPGSVTKKLISLFREHTRETGSAF